MVDFLLPPSGSRRGTIPTATLVDALAGELGGGNVFIFRPGGEAGGNVYASWALLHAALLEVEGLRVIFIDTSHADPDYAVIPAGLWDCRDTLFLGKEQVPGVSTDGLSLLGTLENPRGFERLKLAKGLGEGSAGIVLGGGRRCSFRDCTLSTGSEDALACLKVSASERVEIDLHSTTILAPDGDAPATLELSGDAATHLNLYEGVTLEDNALAYANDVVVHLSSFHVQLGGTQVDAGGSLTFATLFSYDQAEGVTQATGAARFGPWRSASANVSPGLSYDAQDKERVLLSGALGLGETFTVNIPTGAEGPAPDGTTFTIKNINFDDDLAIIVNAGVGNFIETVVSRGTAQFQASVTLPPGGYVTWERQGTWFIVGEGALV